MSGPSHPISRFDAKGNDLDDPRLINTTTAMTQDRPRIAVAGDGSFLVIWPSTEDDGFETHKWVRSRAFNSNGTPKGGEQLVSNVSAGTAALIDMDVAALRKSDGSNGGWVVVCESFKSGSDNSGSGILAQLISAAGVPTGPPIPVNATTPGSQRKPAVTELADGGFFVVWLTLNLQGRRFSAAGAPRGGQFQVNTLNTGINDEPDVAIGWDGVVAVVWEKSSEIRARFFNREVNAQGADFQVNPLTTNIQEEPRLGDAGPIGFLVTWSSINASVGTDTNLSVQARVVAGAGTFGGPQVQWNVWEMNNQYSPVANGWYGRVGSAWESLGNDQSTTSPFADHITGRDIDFCIFCEDSEWGSSWRWSVTEDGSP